jgi:hypothetical protein
MNGTMKMSMLVRVASGFFCAATLFAATPDWKTATVQDSQTVRKRVVTAATSQTTGEATSSTVGQNTTTNGQATTQTRVHSVDVRTSQLLIVGDEFSYVVNDTRASGGNLYGAIGHSIANRKHGCRFVIGDTVKYYQDKGSLHVIDADGKECKTEIVRQERLQTP